MNINLQMMTQLNRADLRKISERDFQRAVREFAESNGWKVHFQGKTGGFGRDGKTWRSTAPKGWPDLTLARESDQRLMMLELKTMNGKATETQEAWLQTLAIVGCETDVVRPSDAAVLIDRLS